MSEEIPVNTETIETTQIREARQRQLMNERLSNREQIKAHLDEYGSPHLKED